MPDKITEFINVAGKTYDELKAGVIVAEAKTGEAAVVTDVQVKQTGSSELQLRIGNMPLASFSGDAQFSGKEALGEGTSLILETLLSPVVNEFSIIQGSWFKKNKFSTIHDPASVPDDLALNHDELQISGGSSVTANFLFIADNGNVYYANMSNGHLYKRAGDVHGAETVFSDFGHTLCHDGERYIYGFNNSGQIKTLDTSNDSVTTKNRSGWQTPSSSYAHCCCIDGWVWLHPAYNDLCYLIDPATGDGVQLGGYNSGSGQRYYVAVNKNTDGDYVFMQLDHTGPLIRCWNVGKTLDLNAQVLKQTDHGSGFDYYAGTSNSLFRVPGVDRFIFYSEASKFGVFDLDAMTIVGEATFGGGSYDNNSARFFGADTVRAATEFGLTDIRATGVLSKE